MNVFFRCALLLLLLQEEKQGLEENLPRSFDLFQSIVCKRVPYKETDVIKKNVRIRLCFRNTIACVRGCNASPHIVMVLVDDLGWNDVSWHNNFVLTPNIERLANEGVILDQAYAQEVCTPSRAAFLTGKLPIHTGMQEGTVTATQTNGLPISYKLLPEYLKEVGGYSTYMIGKWHLGFCDEAYTPTRRGFDSHYGFYNGHLSYYDHEADEAGETGLDYRDDLTLNTASTGLYTTTDFTDEAIRKISAHDTNTPMFLYMAYNAPHSPFEVNSTYTDMYSSLSDGDRKTYLGMVTALDDQIYRLEQALIDKGMWNNTVFVFYSDNGGVAKQNGQGGNNYPLRGSKGSLWEGGYRVIGFVRSNSLNNKGYHHEKMVHITDLFATFIYLASDKNTTAIPTDIDGLNVWESISDNTVSPRTQLIYNIISKKTTAKATAAVTPHAAVRVDNFKLIEGPPGNYVDLDSWVKPPENQTDVIGNINTHLAWTVGSTDYYLFDLDVDPYETNNLAASKPAKVNAMKNILRQSLNNDVVNAIPNNKNSNAVPSNSANNAWNPGYCTAT